MSRRKPKGRPVNGWLILDKPTGLGSTPCVAITKRLFDAQKAGHAGTLDPLASGLLPIAFGEATKTVPYVFDGTKRYLFTITWGTETDTDDSEGKPLHTSPDRPTVEAIEALLPQFEGEISQVPPQYSAIKLGGARAYDLAREGEEFELEARTVTINSLQIVAEPTADTCTLEAVCGKGTYVRAIARDLGRLLGCFGHVTMLRRTAVGPFTEDDAITLERLEEMGREAAAPADLDHVLGPVHAALETLTGVPVSTSDADRLKRGQAVILRGASAPIISGPAYAVCRGALVAIGEVERGEFSATRVFNIPMQPSRARSGEEHDGG
jgi:tRNA pseudouridine55 synthase